MIRADLVIRDVREALTCAGPAPRAGGRQQDVSAIPHATIAALEGRIVFVGPTATAEAQVEPIPGARVIDGRQFSAVPGFVDAHTHAVYAGNRTGELRRRLAGASYAEIAAAGGGIVSTVKATREASEDELVA